MPYFVRRIKDKDKWQVTCDCLDGLTPPSDPFHDLEAKKCTLSIYRIDDSVSNLEEVLVEFYLMGQRHKDLYFIQLEETDLTGFSVQKTRGKNLKCKNTPDFHFDIDCLSAQQMTNLFTVIWNARNQKIKVMSKEDMADYLERVRQQGNLDKSEIPDDIKKTLNII